MFIIIIIIFKLLLNHLGKYYHGNHFSFFFGEDGMSSHYLVFFGPFPPFILPSLLSPFFPSTLLSLLLSPISSYLFSLLQFSVSPSSILPISDSPFSLSLSLSALTLSLPSGESRNFQLNNFNSHKLQD